MRLVLTSLLVAACSSSSPHTDPHAIVTCNSPTFGSGGQCEAGCATYKMGSGLSCQAMANDAGVSSCSDAFYFEGVEGCCEHVVNGIPVFTECK